MNTPDQSSLIRPSSTIPTQRLGLPSTQQNRDRLGMERINVSNQRRVWTKVRPQLFDAIARRNFATALLQNYDFADRNESANESRKWTSDSHQLHDRYNVLLI